MALSSQLRRGVAVMVGIVLLAGCGESQNATGETSSPVTQPAAAAALIDLTDAQSPIALVSQSLADIDGAITALTKKKFTEVVDLGTAGTTVDLERMRQALLMAIDERIQRTNDLAAAVDESQTMTPAHKSALSAELAVLSADLDAFRTSATTLASVDELQEAATQLVQRFRVMEIESLKVQAVQGLDAAATGALTFIVISNQMQSANEALAAAGATTTTTLASATDVGDLQELKQVAADAASEIDAVLAVNPQTYDAKRSPFDSVTSRLRSLKSTLEASRRGLKANVT